MANIKFEYTNKEIIEVLLKANNIHEGNWILGTNLTFSTINIGQSPEGTDVSPAAVVAITGIIIERVSEPLPFSVNAAEINPKT